MGAGSIHMAKYGRLVVDEQFRRTSRRLKDGQKCNMIGRLAFFDITGDLHRRRASFIDQMTRQTDSGLGTGSQLLLTNKILCSYPNISLESGKRTSSWAWFEYFHDQARRMNMAKCRNTS